MIGKPVDSAAPFGQGHVDMSQYVAEGNAEVSIPGLRFDGMNSPDCFVSRHPAAADVVASNIASAAITEFKPTQEIVKSSLEVVQVFVCTERAFNCSVERHEAVLRSYGVVSVAVPGEVGAHEYRANSSRPSIKFKVALCKTKDIGHVIKSKPQQTAELMYPGIIKL